jgi:hypothetical protein
MCTKFAFTATAFQRKESPRQITPINDPIFVEVKTFRIIFPYWRPHALLQVSNPINRTPINWTVDNEKAYVLET